MPLEPQVSSKNPASTFSCMVHFVRDLSPLRPRQPLIPEQKRIMGSSRGTIQPWAGRLGLLRIVSLQVQMIEAKEEFTFVKLASFTVQASRLS